MIDVSNRPFAYHIEPCKAVSFVAAPIDADIDMRFSDVYFPGNRTYWTFIA